jgi:2-methylcitrate synthase
MAGKGLEDVVAAQTALSQVFGDEGRLIYRGYDIEDLAENASFEETCYLLWFGELPQSKPLENLRQQFSANFVVDSQIIDVVRTGARRAHPTAQLRTAVSALSAVDPEAEDMSPEANQRKAIRLTAQAITLTAAIARLEQGKEPIPPRSDLALAGNLLYMLRGEPADELSTRILDLAFTLHAEHAMNASTFAARVAAGTLADMHSAVVAAIATLKGPLHGGANEQVMAMLLDIAEPERAADWVRAALARGDKVMGFGHRVYRTTDPRAPILKRMAERLNRQSDGRSRWLDISERIQETMREEMDRRGKKVYPNVDFFSASVYYTLGFQREMFTCLFVCARMAGWTAHIMEQYQDNRLIRPQSEYTGPADRKVPPLATRG